MDGVFANIAVTDAGIVARLVQNPGAADPFTPPTQATWPTVTWNHCRRVMIYNAGNVIVFAKRGFQADPPTLGDINTAFSAAAPVNCADILIPPGSTYIEQDMQATSWRLQTKTGETATCYIVFRS